jgi:hypothetical protein
MAAPTLKEISLNEVDADVHARWHEDVLRVEGDQQLDALQQALPEGNVCGGGPVTPPK